LCKCVNAVNRCGPCRGETGTSDHQRRCVLAVMHVVTGDVQPTMSLRPQTGCSAPRQCGRCKLHLPALCFIDDDDDDDDDMGDVKIDMGTLQLCWACLQETKASTKKATDDTITEANVSAMDTVHTFTQCVVYATFAVYVNLSVRPHVYPSHE